MSIAKVERLCWSDPELGRLHLAKGIMTLRQGFGSGLAARPGDPPGHFWAVGDRGPNIKVREAIRRYGLDHLAPLGEVSGAKIMPRLDVGPAIGQFRIVDDAVELVDWFPIRNRDGRPISGLPNPESEHLLSEPVFDLDGVPLAADPDGLDTEGLVATRDGGFWVGDEFGPSLVRLDAQGRVVERLLPAEAGRAVSNSDLPAIAAQRQLNRGFEALAITADEAWLYLAFQSPLAHPDGAAHRKARHVRIWRLDAATGAVLAQFAYPLDSPKTFERDNAAGKFERDDIKVSELLWLAGDRLLVLERGSATTKLYLCAMDCEPLDPSHLDQSTWPTLEELSAGTDHPNFAALSKRLVLSSDQHTELSADLEGMVLLSPSELLLVNDNDFGVEGVETAFWRISLPEPI